MSAVYPRATLFRTDLHVVKASATGELYQVTVRRPFQYETATDAYPVVYALDGDTLFGAAVQLLAALSLGQELPRLLIAGVGYGIEAYEEWAIKRTRDFTPTSDPAHAGSGGASQFLDFLATDVIPLVDASYRTVPDRTLYGHSLGGLFVLYALVRQPALFERYLAASPSLWWDDRLLLRAAEQATASSSARVCMTVGSEEENLSLIEEMGAKLKSMGPSKLEVSTLVFEGESHYSSIAPALIKGMTTLFA